MKSRCLLWMLLLSAALTSAVWSMPWLADRGVEYARRYHGNLKGPVNPRLYNRAYHYYPGHDCTNFGSQIADACCDGAISWLPRYKTAGAYDSAGCSRPPIWVDDRGAIPRVGDLLKLLTSYLHCPSQTYLWPSSMRWQVKTGDFVFFVGAQRHFQFLALRGFVWVV